MNFQDLMQKMKDIDEGLESQDKYTHADQDVEEMGDMPATSNAETPLMGDTDMEECGGMPSMGPMSSMAPKQQDNVTMNVSMNGSGAGGIRDLMSILKNIEQGGSDAEKDMVVGLEQMANTPDEQTAPVDAVIPTGDDLHSKGGEAPKVNGGGNPMQRGVSEGLLDQLNNLYKAVQLR
jgi:hypothetical protein